MSGSRTAYNEGNARVKPYSSSSGSMQLAGGKGKQAAQVHEWTTRTKHEDKQSGAYERCTAKEKVSTWDTYVERGSGRVGVKDECKRSSTIKIGDRNGYTEYCKEETVRKVDFGGYNKTQHSTYDHSYNSNNRLTYDSDDDLM
ncbi:uncharacterized protein LOC131155319 [Malania oleifera]|uniref:uncharacterized protein LOC131155319 n=1 Tax=Malania oleifera TaxID=397392 RepID=UPI0025AE3F4E|nr:uncharacterized protein LOC131155319 [Malania oleifera]